MADDCWRPPAAVPTCIFGALRSMLDISASGVRYMLLAPESTMAVRRLSSLSWRRLESFLSHFAVTLLPGGSGGILGGGWV